jgi:hypothetical protein
MIMEESFDVQSMKDGLRYRRKRKHNELSKIEEDVLMRNEIEKEDKSKGKKFKYAQNKENLNSVAEGGDVNINKKDKVESIKIGSNFNQNQNQNIINNINNITGTNINNNVNNNVIQIKKQEIPPNNNILISDVHDIPNQEIARNAGGNLNKKVYIKEFERMKIIVKKYEEYFNNDYLKLLLTKTLQCCEKNSKNIRSFKVTSLFKNDKFKFDTSIYSSKTTIINLELITIDLLMASRNQYESLLEVDCPNMGNILLCYYSQVNIIKTLKSILSQMEGNIEKVNFYFIL